MLKFTVTVKYNTNYKLTEHAFKSHSRDTDRACGWRRM